MYKYMHIHVYIYKLVPEGQARELNIPASRCRVVTAVTVCPLLWG